MSLVLTKKAENMYFYNRSSSEPYTELCKKLGKRYDSRCLITSSGMNAISIVMRCLFDKIGVCNLVYSASDSTFVNNSLWNISSTTTFDGLGKVASDNMESNFTKGLDNISEKLPTILLIAAVVLLFGVLVILVARSRQMGIGGTSGASL